MLGSADAALDPMVAFVERMTELRRYAIGCQMFVSRDGRVLADAGFGVDACGEPIDPQCLQCIYCAGKPFTSVALAAALSAHGTPVDTPLGELLDGRRLAAPELRLSDLLTHRAGLDGIDAADVAMLPLKARDELVFAAQPDPGFRVGRDAAYSQYASWHLLGRVIESLVGLPLGQYVNRDVLPALGLREPVFVGGMTSEDFGEVQSRLRVNAWLDGDTTVPMLVEATEPVCCTWNPSLGTYTTMRDLGLFYQALVDERDSRSW